MAARVLFWRIRMNRRTQASASVPKEKAAMADMAIVYRGLSSARNC